MGKSFEIILEDPKIRPSLVAPLFLTTYKAPEGNSWCSKEGVA